MNMGIATRMAILMSLHREETYYLEPNAPSQVVMRAESARRTLVGRPATLNEVRIALLTFVFLVDVTQPRQFTLRTYVASVSVSG